MGLFRDVEDAKLERALGGATREELENEVRILRSDLERETSLRRAADEELEQARGHLDARTREAKSLRELTERLERGAEAIAGSARDGRRAAIVQSAHHASADEGRADGEMALARRGSLAA